MIVNPESRRARANSGGARNAKHDDDGAPPHFDAVWSVSVPSRLPKTTSPVSAERRELRYVPGDVGRVGVVPSIVSPTAATVTVPCGVVSGGSVLVAVVAALLDVRGRLPAAPERPPRSAGDETPSAAATPATTTTASANATIAIRRSRRARWRARSRPSCAPKSSNRHLSSPTVTLEQRILDEVAAGREELVELTSALIGFDTTARDPDDPARDEADLQAYLGERLGKAGAAVDIWEPDPGDVAGTRQIPPGLGFSGRPQLAARFAGGGGGRSLLLNGHIDVVPSDPRERWTSDPNAAEVRDGNLYGRGACDMKGGVACMVYAAEVLSRLGVKLAGDLVVNTVTDEESSGAGGLAAARHGVRADAGIVPEPTAFEVWVACRGSLTPTISVEGRPGHAEMAQPHWKDGGAVNAIEKMSVVLDAVRRLREEWMGRPDKRHPHLSSGTIVPVKISGGEWTVTYPASCSLTCEVMYLPGNADGDGWGTAVEAEVEA